MKTRLYNFFATIIIFSCFASLPAKAKSPLWTMTPAAGSLTTQTLAINSSAIVNYIVRNQSLKAKQLVIEPIQGITQASRCQLAARGQPGSSCILNLTITGSAIPTSGIHSGPVLCQTNSDGSPNPNQCYHPSEDNSLNMTLGTTPMASIKVNPTTLSFEQFDTGGLTITNADGAVIPAKNIVASIPGGSNISVQSSTCLSTLRIGSSCTIIFTSPLAEGPTSIQLAALNSNTVKVNVTVTTAAQTTISISAPSQSQRAVAVGSTPGLTLSIFNNSTTTIARGITVADKSACPNLQFIDSDCANVIPGGSCILSLSSTTTYVPCTLTINGINTSTLTTPIAFSYLGGLVFQKNNDGSGKVLLTSSLANMPWTASTGNISNTDNTNGQLNTSTIINASPCFNDNSNCSAFTCYGLYSNRWYLPAINDWLAVASAFCPDHATCNFGEFSPDQLSWSSTQDSSDTTKALMLELPSGDPISMDKTDGSQTVFCAQNFP